MTRKLPDRPEPDPNPERADRREARRQSKRRRMAKHGGSLRRVYRDAVLKRPARRYRKR